MARLIWTERALGHFERSLEYIEDFAPAAARRLARRIIQAADRLKRSPQMGGFIAEDPRRIHREILVGKYRLIHRLEGDYVYIAAVWHSSRLLDLSDLG
jgi:plasmid stabilization system protein ParE